jgi:hypothetical protein
VLYNNKFSDIKKTIISIRNAFDILEKENESSDAAMVVCGDSSEEQLLSNSDIEWITETLGKSISFEYRYFGFNSGYGKGHNLLAEKSDSQYLLIMNPDVILSPRFFIEMLSPFSDEYVGMVEARQSPVEHQKEYNIDTKETDWATGACVLVKTDIYQALKGFDDKNFFMYCEDVDFSWRMRLAGYKIIYEPLAPVFHSKKLSAKGRWMPTDTEVYFSAVSSLMMAYKWSNDEELNRLKIGYKSTEVGIYRKAADYFDELEKKGELPQRLDFEHKVANFKNGYYSENKYVL